MAYGMAKAALEHLTVSRRAPAPAASTSPVNTFRIDVPVASEGFVVQLARRRPLRLGAVGGRGRGHRLDARAAARATPATTSGMAALRAEHGIMASRERAPPRRARPAVNRVNPMPLPACPAPTSITVARSRTRADPRDRATRNGRACTAPRARCRRARFPGSPRARAFAERVVGSLWWAARFPDSGLGDVPRFRPGNGARQAFYREDPGGPTITLPRRYRTKGVVLHELVHWALAASTTSRTTARRSHASCSTRCSSSADPSAPGCCSTRTGAARARRHAAVVSARGLRYGDDERGVSRSGVVHTRHERRDATLAAVDRFNEAFNRHDVDAVMAAMTDDCVFESTSPPHGERFVGRAAVRAFWEQFFARAPAHFDAEEVIVAGDSASCAGCTLGRRHAELRTRRRRHHRARRQGRREARVRQGLTPLPVSSMRRSSAR